MDVPRVSWPSLGALTSNIPRLFSATKTLGASGLPPELRFRSSGSTGLRFLDPGRPRAARESWPSRAVAAAGRGAVWLMERGERGSR